MSSTGLYHVKSLLDEEESARRANRLSGSTSRDGPSGLDRRPSQKSYGSDSAKNSFRRSMSNLAESLSSFGKGDSSRRSMQLERPLSARMAASASTQTLDSNATSKRERRISLKSLSSLKSWGSQDGSKVQNDAPTAPRPTGLPRSSSSMSHRSGFGETMRNFRQRASDFGTVKEVPDNAEMTFVPPKPKQEVAPTSAATRVAEPPRASTSKAAKEPVQSITTTSTSIAPVIPESAAFPTTLESSRSLTTPRELPPTPDIQVDAVPRPEAVPRDPPAKPAVLAPRLSFGGDQLVDDDWGDLTEKQEVLPVPRTGLAIQDKEFRRESVISEAHSDGEIREATQAVRAGGQLVRVKDGEGQLNDAHGGFDNHGVDNHEMSLPAPPARAISNRSSASSLPKQSPIKRLISSDSWRKLSLSAAEMTSSKSKSSATETEGSAPATERDERRMSLESESSLDESAPKTPSYLEPLGVPESKETDLARSMSGRSLTTRLTTPGNRSSFGEAATHFDTVEAGQFSRRTGSVLDNLAALAAGTSAPSSTRSSPVTDRPT